jgi:predicted ester cyclase
MRRFITLGTIALIVAAGLTQWRRVKELGRQVLSRRTTEEMSVPTEENKALVQRSWEISSPENLDEVYPPDVVWHMPEGDLRGIEEAKRYASTFFEALPDVSISVEDLLADGDKVASRVRFRGTHQGETEEFGPPTGRQVELEGITIHRIEGGKIVEEWNQFDNLSILQQLGLAPEQ